MPEDVSFPGFRHHFLCAPNWPGRTTLQQDPSAHVYSVLFLLSLYFPCLYFPRTLGLSLFYTLSSHPRTAGHATSPGMHLKLIRAAGAYLHQNGFTGILVHLCSSQDVCGLYEEVRCKSYDFAAVSGAFGTAAIPTPHISPFFSFLAERMSVDSPPQPCPLPVLGRQTALV